MQTNSSPLRHLLTGAGAQFVTLIISAVIGFLLTPYMIRTLGSRDYGIMVLVGTFTGWLGLMDLGLSGAVSRYITVSFAKKDLDGCNAYLSSGFYLYLGLGCGGLLVATIAAMLAAVSLSSEKDSVTVPVLIVLAGMAFAIDLPLRAFAGLINGCMRQDLTGFLHLLGRITRACVTVSVLVLGGRLIALSVGGLLATVCVAMTWWSVARSVLPGCQLARRCVSKESLRSLFSFGGVSFVGRVTEACLFRIDGFVIAYFLSVAYVAHYNIATTLVSYFQMTMMAFTGWLLQWFAHKAIGRGEDARESLLIATRYSVFIGAFCLFGLVAWGKPFIERWMGVEYLGAYPCLVALSIAMFLRGCQMPNLNLLLAHARHHLFVSANAVEGVINIACSIVLVQFLGLTGIAVGTMIASVLVNGLLFPFMCCRLTGTSVAAYYGTYLHALAVALIGVSVPWLLASIYSAPYYGRLVVLGAVSTVVYFNIVVVFGSSAAERRRVWAACFS
jgi:O-antigen/teichoic acid export membrane protein